MEKSTLEVGLSAVPELEQARALRLARESQHVQWQVALLNKKVTGAGRSYGQGAKAKAAGRLGTGGKPRTPQAKRAALLARRTQLSLNLTAHFARQAFRK